MRCPLCLPITPKTIWHGQNDKITILDCDSCNIPMWVWNDHKKDITNEEKEYGRNKCRELFGKKISFRGPRKILDHYHEHVIRG